MKEKASATTAIIFILTFFYASFGYSGWTTPSNVSDSNAESSYPMIAVDSDGYVEGNEEQDPGRPHVTWTEASGDDWQTFYRMYDTSWSSITYVHKEEYLELLSEEETLPWIVVESLTGDNRYFRADIAFSVINSDFYDTSAHSEIVVRTDIEAEWPDDEDHFSNPHLQHISGLQKGIIEPCLGFYYHNKPGDEDQFALAGFWSQADPSDNRAIYHNYQERRVLHGTINRVDWMQVIPADDDSWPYSNGVKKRMPYAVTNAEEGVYEGDIHLFTYDDGATPGSAAVIHTLWDDSDYYWDEDVVVPGTSYGKYPSAAINPSDGKVYIAYLDTNTEEYKWRGLPADPGASTPTPTGTPEPTPGGVIDDAYSDPDTRPVIGFDNDDNFYVAYIKAITPTPGVEYKDVFVKKYDVDAETWTNAWQVDTSNLDHDHRWVHLAVDPNTQLPNIVYDEKDDSGYWDVWWAYLE